VAARVTRHVEHVERERRRVERHASAAGQRPRHDADRLGGRAVSTSGASSGWLSRRAATPPTWSA
jgi:hypothetical protein